MASHVGRIFNNNLYIVCWLCIYTLRNVHVIVHRKHEIKSACFSLAKSVPFFSAFSVKLQRPCIPQTPLKTTLFNAFVSYVLLSPVDGPIVTCTRSKLPM